MYTIAAAILLGVAAAAPQWGPPGHPGHPSPSPTHHTTTYHHTTPGWPGSTSWDHSTTATTTKHHSAGITVTAKFDNLTPSPTGAADPIGIYDYLYYQGLAVTNLSSGSAKVAAVVAGIEPESNPNVAYYDASEEASNGNPVISVSYPGSKVESFDLTKFYFACAIVANKVPNSGPSPCTLVTTAYDEFSSEIHSYSVDFTYPKSTTEVPMQLVQTPLFQNATTVTFKTTTSTSNIVATLFDNFVYTVYTNKARSS